MGKKWIRILTALEGEKRCTRGKGSSNYYRRRGGRNEGRPMLGDGFTGGKGVGVGKRNGRGAKEQRVRS